MEARDFQEPYSNEDIKLAAHGTPAFGSFASVAAAKHTWRLHYVPSKNLSGIVIYLDAATGDILYIYDLPEG